MDPPLEQFEQASGDLSLSLVFLTLPQMEANMIPMTLVFHLKEESRRVLLIQINTGVQ